MTNWLFHGDLCSVLSGRLAMFNGLEYFIPNLLGLVKESGIDVSDYLMDHVCYRTVDVSSFESIFARWRMFASRVHTSEVNGRPIHTLFLEKQITISGRIIRVIELPAPKQGSEYPEGWEHAGFVIGESFAQFISRYRSCDFDMRSFYRELNPELGYQLPDGLRIKFHRLPLERVIEIE